MDFIIEKDQYLFNEVDNLGTISTNNTYFDKHINEVLNLELIVITPEFLKQIILHENSKKTVSKCVIIENKKP